MNLLAALKERFRPHLAALVDAPEALIEMVRPSQDPRFGDYQANFAMPLAKQLNRNPRELAAEIAAQTELEDLCEPPEVAGPGFINLRIKDARLQSAIECAARDQRLGVAEADPPWTVVIDFSSPNVAKPMHVGHIRSTVIGDCLTRTLRFLGHRAISDNHIGDWGKQFGMILFGFKHFRDEAAYQQAPVAELARLYQLVHRLESYFDGFDTAARLEVAIAAACQKVDELASEGAGAAAQASKALKKARKKLSDVESELAAVRRRIADFEADAAVRPLAEQHPDIRRQVLHETALLHAGDEENGRLWREFLPACREEMQRVYQRLNVTFDHELGESFYHDRLADVVADLESRGLAVESDGALCVFLDEFDTPMIVRKQDGAFLYATSDLATIDYRTEQWAPDKILYVVDHRQSEHFDKLFAVARKCGRDEVDLRHIRFGTVCGADGKPFKTREGAASLEWLLDEAVAHAYSVVCDNDQSGLLDEATRRRVADEIGHAAIKYYDLSQNRESDYEFNLERMVKNEGNTATYMQYSYARIMSVFRKGAIDPESIRTTACEFHNQDERQLGLALVRFEEALQDVLIDFRPNLLTDYLYQLSKVYTTFYEKKENKVLVDDPQVRNRRLLLCDLTARTLKQGLELLGIRSVDRM